MSATEKIPFLSQDFVPIVPFTFPTLSMASFLTSLRSVLKSLSYQETFSDQFISKSCTLTLIILCSLVFFIALTTIISVHVFFNNRYSNTFRMNGFIKRKTLVCLTLLLCLPCQQNKSSYRILYFSTTFFLCNPHPGMLSSPFLCLFRSCL